MPRLRGWRYSGAVLFSIGLTTFGLLTLTDPQRSAAQNPTITGTLPITVTPSPVGTLTMTPTFIPASSQTPDVPDAGISYDYFHMPDSGAPVEAPHLYYIGATLLQMDFTLRLTPYNDKLHHAGAIWEKSKQTVNGGFETQFTFQMYKPGEGGADGFAFVLQNASPVALGAGGCGLGYAGIPHSVIIEFDTYHNDELCPATNDPSDNHLGIMFNGDNAHHDPALVYDIPKSELDLHDGRAHTAIIRYDVQPVPKFTITIGPYRREEGTTVTWEVPFDASKLDTDPDGRMWVGFTAGTYLERQNHNIDEWYLQRFMLPPPPTPSRTPAASPSLTRTQVASPTGTATKAK